MKPITLHPLSVLVGIALAGALVGLTGATQQPLVARRLPTETRILGVIPAEWWTHVVIDDYTVVGRHTTYTVPTDRYFVVTFSRASTTILQDGQVVSTLLDGVPDVSDNPPHEANGTRIVFPPGSFLELPVGSNNSAMFWGYLEPVD